jgi:hypothetical protein
MIGSGQGAVDPSFKVSSDFFIGAGSRSSARPKETGE